MQKTKINILSTRAVDEDLIAIASSNQISIHTISFIDIDFSADENTF